MKNKINFLLGLCLILLPSICKPTVSYALLAKEGREILILGQVPDAKMLNNYASQKSVILNKLIIHSLKNSKIDVQCFLSGDGAAKASNFQQALGDFADKHQHITVTTILKDEFLYRADYNLIAQMIHYFDEQKALNPLLGGIRTNDRSFCKLAQFFITLTCVDAQLKHILGTNNDFYQKYMRAMVKFKMIFQEYNQKQFAFDAYLKYLKSENQFVQAFKQYLAFRNIFDILDISLAMLELLGQEKLAEIRAQEEKEIKDLLALTPLKPVATTIAEYCSGPKTTKAIYVLSAYFVPEFTKLLVNRFGFKVIASNSLFNKIDYRMHGEATPAWARLGDEEIETKLQNELLQSLKRFLTPINDTNKNHSSGNTAKFSATSPDGKYVATSN
jgi:hypothetical protein